MTDAAGTGGAGPSHWSGPLPVPNLVIIGAQKSGTTSLHRALGRHPDIHMSRPLKEATYFLPEDMMVSRVARYGYAGVVDRETLVSGHMLKGYRGQRYFGESSTDYTMSNRARTHDIPVRMAELQPDMRFIYIVRHPLDRMVSARRHLIDRTGRDPFAEIAGGDDSALGFLRDTSMYGFQMAAYLDHFPRNRFHVMAFEDFAADQSAALRGVTEFLGLAPMGSIPEVHRNERRGESDEAAKRIPRAVLARVHEAVVEDMETFRRISGFDTTRWNLDFDAWCAPAQGDT
jgi:hypothetical protein